MDFSASIFNLEAIFFPILQFFLNSFIKVLTGLLSKSIPPSILRLLNAFLKMQPCLVSLMASQACFQKWFLSRLIFRGNAKNVFMFCQMSPSNNFDFPNFLSIFLRSSLTSNAWGCFTHPSSIASSWLSFFSSSITKPSVACLGPSSSPYNSTAAVAAAIVTAAKIVCFEEIIFPLSFASLLMVMVEKKASDNVMIA